MNRLSLNSRGISLLEVLIAMLILGFGIIGLAPMMVLSIDTNAHSRDLSLATQLAKERLENIEAAASIGSVPSVVTEDSVGGKFMRVTSITGHASDTLIPPNRYKVVVVMSWTDDDGMYRSSKMSTLIRKE